jgi:hypothetical protein
MYSYWGYGLSIRSALSLPELSAPAETFPDVVIRLERADHPVSESIHAENSFHVTAKEACLCWRMGGRFLIRNGKEIVIHPAAEADEALIRLLVLGPVLAILLHQRGLLVLHASAVAVEGGAVLFIGGKGAGKSTMAAALYARGHSFLADDVAAVSADGGQGPVVLPGSPQLKLWPEAAASSLGDDPDRLPQLASGFEKRARPVSCRFANSPQPLRGIYVLSRGPSLKIETLTCRQALMTLMRHSHCARFGSQLLHGTEASAHFLRCTDLARHVPVRFLQRPPCLEALADLAQTVEMDLTNGAV